MSREEAACCVVGEEIAVAQDRHAAGGSELDGGPVVDEVRGEVAGDRQLEDEGALSGRKRR